MDRLTNKVIREAAEKMIASQSPSQSERVSPDFLKVLQTVCMKTKDTTLWSMYCEGTEGQMFRKEIYATYNRFMKSSIDEDRIIFSEEEFFIKIKANDILLNFCSYLLVKLFDAKTFAQNEKIDNALRVATLGNTTVRRYKELLVKLDDPSWRQRISVPLEMKSYVEAFPFAKTDQDQSITLDCSSDEEGDDAIEKTGKCFLAVQNKFQKQKSELNDELLKVEGKLEEIEGRIQELNEQKEMLALVKVNFACLSTLRTPPTDDLKTCFKMFKQILTICKDKQIENDQLIAFCLEKLRKRPVEHNLGSSAEFAKFSGEDISVVPCQIDLQGNFDQGSSTMVHLQIKEMDNNPVCDALIEGVRVPQEEGDYGSLDQVSNDSFVEEEYDHFSFD